MAGNFPLAATTSSSQTQSSRSIQPPQTLIPPDSLLRYLRRVTHGRCPDKPTFISIMKTCACISDIPLGRSIHAHIIKYGLAADRFVATSIISFYSACGLPMSARRLFGRIPDKDVVLWTSMLLCYAENGDIDGARKLFDEFPVRDVAAWNAMLSCYLRCGFPEETLKLFRQMQAGDLPPNEITLTVVLSACSQIGFLSSGKRVHAYIIRSLDFHGGSTTLINALLHMYAKCGQPGISLTIFIHQLNKNLESWNTLLTGFAVHGFTRTCYSLFSQMIKNGVSPDRITLLALLMACSHSGKVVDSTRFFAGFSEVYRVESGPEHHGCLVDALSRRGLLGEARMLIEFDSDASCWGALLSGCFAVRDRELGLEAGERLIGLEPCNESRYVSLSNLLSTLGDAGGAMKVRRKMIDLGIRKSSGMSLIENGGEVHKFLSGDRSHAQSGHIYAIIDSLHSNMR